MLTLLMHWVPALSAYPEAVPAYLQLMAWIQRTTPGLAGQLESSSTSSGSGSAKKKKTSSSQKTPPAKASKPEAVGSTSGSQAALAGTSEFSQGAVIVSELPGVFAALRRQSGVLADHLQGNAYRSLQVCGLCDA